MSIASNDAHRKSEIKGAIVTATGIRVVNKVKIRGCRPGGGNRGNITTFSADSARRMRQWLLEKEIPDTQLWSVTLTLPLGGRDNCPLDIFKAICDLYWHKLKLRDWFKGAVYRVELQQNGNPHIHALVYTSKATGFMIPEIYWGIRNDWEDAVFAHADMVEDDCLHFLQYGSKVEIQPGDDRFAIWLKYIVSHASKKKQAQLGYPGKQWGIINRKNFVDTPFSRLDFPDDFNFDFWRQYAGEVLGLSIVNGERCKLSGTRFASPRDLDKIVAMALEMGAKIRVSDSRV